MVAPEGLARLRLGHLDNTELPHTNGEAKSPVESPFKSVAVIGAAGQTGQLYSTLLEASDFKVEAVVRSPNAKFEADHQGMNFHRSATAMLAESQPDLVIMATPNPTENLLKEIAESIQKPFTLVLPQNGVDVVDTAQRVLEYRSGIKIVRASLWTNVSWDKKGNLKYNKKKNRISLAPVPLMGKHPNPEEQENLNAVEEMFKTAGFKVAMVDDYKSMEWTKLIANLWGSSSSVTGFSPLRTLADRRLFQLEHRGLKDRMAALEAEGIKFADIKWASQLKFLARLPSWVSWFPSYPFIPVSVAVTTAKARNNQPSAAAREIFNPEEKARRVEPTIFYHKPMYELAYKHDLESPADLAIHDMLVRHALGRNEVDKFDLTDLSASARRKLLLEVFNLEKVDVFINKWSFRGFDFIREGMEWYHRSKTRSFEIKGQENLAPVVESLRNNRSVLVTPNHRSNADHPTIMKALQDSLPEDLAKTSIYIVSGMKFDKEKVTGVLKYAYSHPVLWTLEPSDNPERRWKAKIVNKRAERVIKKLLDEGPCIMVVYLEGGRNKSEDLELQLPSEGSGKWLIDTHFDYDVPVVIQGTERMMAPGEQFANEADLSLEFLLAIPTESMKAQRVHSGKLDELFAIKPMEAIALRLPRGQRRLYLLPNGLSADEDLLQDEPYQIVV